MNSLANATVKPPDAADGPHFLTLRAGQTVRNADHSTLEAGVAYTSLEYKVSLVRALNESHGEVAAEGNVVHRGRRMATAEGRIVDSGGKILRTVQRPVSSCRRKCPPSLPFVGRCALNAVQVDQERCRQCGLR